MTATEKSELKRKVLDACIAKQQSLIDDFKSRIKAISESEGLGNEEEYDNNELSQKGQASDEVNALSEALSLANEEMEVLFFLKSSQNRLQTTVAPGAVVVTDKATFFVSVSIEGFDAEGKNYIGVSSKSPLYLTMKGLTSGSIFQQNGKAYKIIDIF